MIDYPGYDGLIRKVHDHNQEHVFEYWDELSGAEKRELLDDLSDVDFDLIQKLMDSGQSIIDSDFSPAPYVRVPFTEEEIKEHDLAREAGEAYIRKGKAAAFVVAGGQGSRLGYEGPKGKFKIGPVSRKSLFQLHSEKILKYSQKYHTSIPLLIMTSRANHEETAAFFAENKYFGLPSEDVFIFSQSMLPSLDPDGRLILETRKSVFKNPDGHGGSLTALHASGALARMKRRGIDIISYFQVDNPLVKIIDPVFIGYHVMRNAEISTKAVKKANPEEKVGVFVRFRDDSIGIVEYSDFPKEKLHELDDKRNLKFSSSNTAIHLFSREFIERVTAGGAISLPFHVAEKRIKAMKGGATREIDGLKFEKFVFDALPLASKNIVFEVLREDEFAPVKNAAGVDSVDSAQKLMIERHRRWLVERGIQIPQNANVIEISPLLAVGPDDIPEDLVVPDQKKVYLT